MKSKLIAAWLAVWAKIKPWIQTKSKALVAAIGSLVLVFGDALIVSLSTGQPIDWNFVLQQALVLVFGIFGLTYVAPANKPLG